MTTLIKNQVKTFRADYIVDGKPEAIVAEVRHDDRCGNGHNTFSITGTIYTTSRHAGEPSITHKGGRKLWANGGGCIHEEIAKRIPALAGLTKWHLCSTEGPMHYIGNTVFLAGDRDHNGNRPGEKRQMRSGSTGKLMWRLKGLA